MLCNVDLYLGGLAKVQYAMKIMSIKPLKEGTLKCNIAMLSQLRGNIMSLMLGLQLMLYYIKHLGMAKSGSK